MKNYSVVNEFYHNHSLSAPQDINNVIFEDKKLEIGSTKSFTMNKYKNYHAVFASYIKNEEEKNKIQGLFKSSSDTVLILSKRDNSFYTNKMLKDIINTGQLCIIVQTWIVGKVSEKVLLKINRITGLFHKTAKNICSREKERILPGINIDKYINISNEKLFSCK